MSKISSKAGEFELKGYTDGHPVFISIYHEDEVKIRIHHKELSDLEYCVQKIKRQLSGVLPEHEM